jgi:hypothetical protein
MKHTRVLYWTKGVGEKRELREHVFENLSFKNAKEVDEYMDYGRPGNFLIEDALYLSRHGALENWKVTKVQTLSDEDFENLDGIRRVEAEIKKYKKETRDLKRDTERMRREIEEIDKSTKRELARFHWESLTPEELKWFVAQRKTSFLFLPSATDIKAQYSQDMATKANEPDKFAGFEELRHTNGWLSPEGRFYPVGGFAQHDKWAGEYMAEHGIEESKRYGGYDYEVLEELGWMRVMDWGAGTKMNFGHQKLPTHEQKETLYLFCALHKIDNPFK